LSTAADTSIMPIITREAVAEGLFVRSSFAFVVFGVGELLFKDIIYLNDVLLDASSPTYRGSESLFFM
jgi:hypothetical protein